MQGPKVMEMVNLMHREKNIPKEVIFSGIENALQVAIERATGAPEGEVTVTIDRISGMITARRGDEVIAPETLGRIPAQSAKNLIIQKIREAESDGVFQEFVKLQGELVNGTIQRLDNGTAIVTVGKTECLLPRSEQIPGETHHVNERIKAVVMEVRRAGQRVRVVLSRCHPDFVRCLFEQEIPEIADRTIEIKAVAREAGYRTKIAVSSIDMKVDCVGACVGVRGARIKNIIDELSGERIDIVRWNDSLQVLIPNSLQPAEVAEVFLYPRLGRAIVLVAEDQLSLAIGRRGQNVRLASKLVGWDIEIMTVEELDQSLARAEEWFGQIPNITNELVESFITEGFLSYRDLTFFEPAQLAEMAGITEEDADDIIAFAEDMADEIEEQEEVRIATEREAAKAARLARAAEGGPPDTVTDAKQKFDDLFAPGPNAAAPANDGPPADGEPAEGDGPPAADGEPAEGDGPPAADGEPAAVEPPAEDEPAEAPPSE
jgi:N utilization substance protein A